MTYQAIKESRDDNIVLKVETKKSNLQYELEKNKLYIWEYERTNGHRKFKPIVYITIKTTKK